MRPGADANMPKVTVRRNSILKVHIRKNNHLGGFSRWSIVKPVDIHKIHKNNAGAFLYECHDINPRRCVKENKKRDCGPDREGRYYAHEVASQLFTPMETMFWDGLGMVD